MKQRLNSPALFLFRSPLSRLSFWVSFPASLSGIIHRLRDHVLYCTSTQPFLQALHCFTLERTFRRPGNTQFSKALPLLPSSYTFSRCWTPCWLKCGNNSQHLCDLTYEHGGIYTRSCTATSRSDYLVRALPSHGPVFLYELHSFVSFLCVLRWHHFLEDICLRSILDKNREITNLSYKESYPWTVCCLCEYWLSWSCSLYGRVQKTSLYLK